MSLKVVTRVSPNAVTWLKAKAFGKKILFIGQSRAGKTTYIRYLAHGIFADDDEERTFKRGGSGVVQLKLGPKESLDLTISSIIDTVGQAPTENHAQDVRAVNPDAVMIFVSSEFSLSDTSDSNAILPYIDALFEHLEEKIARNLFSFSRTKCVIVVLNKVDLLEGGAEGAENRKKIFDFVKPRIARVFGKIVADRSRTMSCSLIEDFDNGKLAKKVAESLGTALTK